MALAAVVQYGGAQALCAPTHKETVHCQPIATADVEPDKALQGQGVLMPRANPTGGPGAVMVESCARIEAIVYCSPQRYHRGKIGHANL